MTAMHYLARNIRQAAIALSLLVASQTLSAQAQRYNATEDNGFGVVYTLPKTEYEITTTVLRKHFTPGEFARWSPKYLGKEAEVNERDHYELIDIRIRTIGVADTARRYIVPFDKKTIAPFVSLMPNGVVYSINGTGQPKPYEPFVVPTYPKPDRSLPAFPREYSLSNTINKRAEIAATYLYELRENAMSIVSGEVEQMPKDGESMRLILDKLRSEEKRTLRLFKGDTTYTVESQTYRIVPEKKNIEKQILFRLSEQWGIVPSNDLSGEAVYLSLNILERAPEIDPKELQKREKGEGIVYNLPGLAEITLHMGERELLKSREPITQVGTIQTLSRKMINLKDAGTTAIYFDPRSGALERVVTE